LLPIAPTKLQFIWFEIASNTCNEKCLHCYAESESKRESSSQCDFKSSDLSFSDWCQLIEDGYRLGCRQCQFIGGEPFMYRDTNGKRLLDLVRFAKATGYEFIEIFTNGTLLTDDKIKQIHEMGINVAVSLYSHVAEIHDSITQIPGSHIKTINALEHMHRLNIPVRVAVVLMRNNQDTIEQTREYLFQQGLDGIKVDVVRPTGRGKSAISPDEHIYKQYALVQKPNFKASKLFVIQSTHENTCLAGKIVISDNGDVLPCIFGREWIMGNVKTLPLKHIISSSQLQELWNFTKDNVMVCRDCEYRYACYDCRPLAFAVNKHVNAPSPRCTYNPYTGEWGKGVWRVDSNGQAIYSEVMEENM